MKGKNKKQWHTRVWFKGGGGIWCQEGWWGGRFPFRRQPLSLEAEKQPRAEAPQRSGGAGKGQQVPGCVSMFPSCGPLRGLGKCELPTLRNVEMWWKLLGRSCNSGEIWPSGPLMAPERLVNVLLNNGSVLGVNCLLCVYFGSFSVAALMPSFSSRHQGLLLLSPSARIQLTHWMLICKMWQWSLSP